MRARFRTWVVDVLADAIVEAGKRNRLHIHLKGSDLITSIEKHKRGHGDVTAV